MKNIDTSFKTIECGYDCFFFGANTGEGYKNTPDERLNEKNCDVKIYIKGGPGTGKSSLMRKFCERAEKAGYRVTRYFCSSDPCSLDALFAEREWRRIAICDATAPHVFDMTYPGAISFVFDLSEFWRGGELRSERQKIIGLSELKSNAYDSSYRALRSALETQKLADSVSESVFRRDKAAKFCERVSLKFKPDGLRTVFGYTTALSMSGAVRLASLEPGCSSGAFVDDSFGTDKLLLRLLYEKLAERGVGLFVSLDPLDGSIESIMTIADRYMWSRRPFGIAEKIVNCERFTDREASKHRNRYRLIKGCAASLISEALHYLGSASEHHFELEKIYTAAMDFECAEKAAEERVFSII